MRKQTLCIGCAAGLVFSVLAPFYTYADTPVVPNGCHMMNYDELADVLPETIQAQWVDANYQFHGVTFTRGSEGASNGVSNYMGGDRPYFPYEADISLGIDTEYMYSQIILFQIPIYLSNVTYFDWRVSSWINLDRYNNQNFPDSGFPGGLHYTVDDANFVAAPLKQENNNTKAATYRIRGGYTEGCSCYLVNYEGPAATIDIEEFTDCYIYQENNHYKLFIFSPIINDDYEIGDVDLDTPVATQVVTGTGDITGVVGSESASLDIHVNINAPDYNGKLDAIQSAINPAYDSSEIDDMHAAIQTAVSEENELLGQASTALTSLPGDLEFDEDLVEDAVNPFTTFFGINIVGIMIFWVCQIAFISYILFGKWV